MSDENPTWMKATAAITGVYGGLGILVRAGDAELDGYGLVALALVGVSVVLMVAMLKPGGGRIVERVVERVVEKEVPVPKAKQPIRSAAVVEQALTVDISKPSEMLDCCMNCGNKSVCYEHQADLLAKWDFHCEDYQRHNDGGPVVDVAALGWEANDE